VPSRIVRDSLAGDIAQKLGIDSAVLRQEFKAAAVSRGTSGVKPAVTGDMTPSEKVLVRAATLSATDETGLRDQVLQALALETLHAGLDVERLLQAILENARALERGEGIQDVMALPLENAERQMLAKIVMQEDEPLTPELLEGALEALRHRQQLSQREVDIKRGIVEAERRNDIAALLRLKQEKLELDRKLAGF
jgi:DNA primase